MLKIKTAASRRNWICSRSRASAGPRLFGAWAKTQLAATANTKTGIVSACARFSGLPRTAESGGEHQICR